MVRQLAPVIRQPAPVFRQLAPIVRQLVPVFRRALAELFPGPFFRTRPDPPGSGPDPTRLQEPII